MRLLFLKSLGRTACSMVERATRATLGERREIEPRKRWASTFWSRRSFQERRASNYWLREICPKLSKQPAVSSKDYLLQVKGVALQVQRELLCNCQHKDSNNLYSVLVSVHSLLQIVHWKRRGEWKCQMIDTTLTIFHCWDLILKRSSNAARFLSGHAWVQDASCKWTEQGFTCAPRLIHAVLVVVNVGLVRTIRFPWDRAQIRSGGPWLREVGGTSWR